ncbi:hypothetical protein ACP4OV_022291 [Aristida adscensionis]
MAVAGGELSMKLVIDAGARRVLYAETSNKVFDFIFRISSGDPSGQLEVEFDWHNSCFANFDVSCRVLRLAADAPPPPPTEPPAKRFFICGYGRGAGCDGYVTDDPRGVLCPSCCSPMEAELPQGAPGAGASSSSGPGNGGDGPLLLCALTDSLGVILMSSPAYNDKLIGLRHKAVGEIEEKTLRIGLTEALAIFKAVFRTKTPLTVVFLGEKNAPDDDGRGRPAPAPPCTPGTPT